MTKNTYKFDSFTLDGYCVGCSQGVGLEGDRPLLSCVILGKLHDLSEPQIPHLRAGILVPAV